MKNKGLHIFFLTFFSLLFVLLTIEVAFPASFIANMVIKTEGKETVNTFYFKDSIYRFDTLQGGYRGYFLIKRDEDFMTFVAPEKQGYMRAPKEFSILMKNNPFEAHFYSSKKFYRLASKSKELLNGLECVKEVYTIEGPSGPEKASEVWISVKYNFPIKLITYHKGKVLAMAELKDIEEQRLDDSIFSIPSGFKEISPEELEVSEKPKKEPDWIKKVKKALILNPPFEKVFHEGDIFRIKVKPDYLLSFELKSPGHKRQQWAHIECFAFKKGKRLKNLGEFGGFVSEKFKDLPEGTDEVVFRVIKGSPKIKVANIASNIIETEKIKAPQNRFFSSRHFRGLKKPRFTIKDDPSDGISSMGKISIFKGNKVFRKEKYYLGNGTSKSWDIYKFDKKANVSVFVDKGSVEVIIQEAVNQPETRTTEKARTKAKPGGGAIKYGLWKVYQYLIMPGMNKPIDMGDWKICINEKNVIPIPGADQPNSEIRKKEVSGPNVSFDITTDIGGLKTHYVGKVKYNGDKVEGQYTAQQEPAPKLNLKLSGKRLGQCKN